MQTTQLDWNISYLYLHHVNNFFRRHISGRPFRIGALIEV